LRDPVERGKETIQKKKKTNSIFYNVTQRRDWTSCTYNTHLK
jgi:hypothetical protein